MENSKIKFKDLRKKYPQFIYEKYFWRITKGNLAISFDFKIFPDIYFKPKIIIKNIDKSRIEKIGKEMLNNLIFHLGLIEMISYWKATCSPEIVIKAGYLDKDQIKWWKDIIIRGMGEFFYENKIDWRISNFLKFIIKQQNEKSPIFVSLKLKNRYLVPISGGKDSIVTLELLKKERKESRCFCLNPTNATRKVMKMSNNKLSIITKREIDKKLLELNQKGFLNGHTPFSAYLAFLTVLVATIFDYKYIAFSNEKSANEGNVKYLGRIINHQWSKSIEFEKKFRSYSKKYLNKNIEYFSFLRKYTELEIAKMFSSYPKYFPIFSSCNVAGKTKQGKRWCRNCPKCLFVFMILYPFIEEEKIIKIFGKNLFEDKKLLPLMQQLIGERKFKPFECVGTIKESLVAFYLNWKKSKIKKRPFLLKYFKKKILSKKEFSHKLLNEFFIFKKV